MTLQYPMQLLGVEVLFQSFALNAALAANKIFTSTNGHVIEG